MLTFKATKSAYIALGIIPFILLMLYLYILLIQRKDSLDVCLILIGVIAMIFIWLNGFRLTFLDETLIYRDGWYRSVTVNLSDIKTAKHTWVPFGRARKDLKIPRFLIVLKNKERVEINTKPFSREAIDKLNTLSE